MRPCRWTFDGDRVFDGVTDGTRWNGFLNVWVTWETHKAVLGHLGDADGTQELHAIKPDPFGGLVDYTNGFATVEVE